MRFGIVTPQISRHDGQGRVNLEIISEALRQGHEVVLFAERAESPWPADTRTGLRRVLLRPPSWLPSRLLRDQLFAWRSRGAIAREAGGCDAILANGFVTWAPCDVNAVHFVHASWLGSPHHPWRLRRDARSLYAGLYTRLNAMLERISFRHAKRVIAVSRSVANDLKRIGVPAELITVIANGVDTDEFHPGAASRGDFGLPDAVPLVLFAGDLKSPRKNLDTVLRALPSVPGLHLAVAGRAEGTPYPDMARMLGVQDRVHFLGFRRDMPTLMRAADLFVFPSRYEPCGLVLLEALASGLPVVTARSVGGSDLIEAEAGIVLDDCDDVDALAATLRSLAADAGLRRTMGSHARGLAERHSWALMARHYVDQLVTSARERPRPVLLQRQEA